MKTLTERIHEGIKAIAKAKAEGKDTSEWEKHVGRLEEKKAIQEFEFQYLWDKVATLSCNGPLSLRCSECGKSHDRVGILVDVAWFDEERTVCWKCWKRLS